MDKTLQQDGSPKVYHVGGLIRAGAATDKNAGSITDVVIVIRIVTQPNTALGKAEEEKEGTETTGKEVLRTARVQTKNTQAKRTITTNYNFRSDVCRELRYRNLSHPGKN